MLLHVMCNSAIIDNTMRPEPFLNELSSLLPRGWRVELSELAPKRLSQGPDGLLIIAGPDGSAASLLIEMKPRLSARQAAELVRRVTPQVLTARPDDRPIVFTRYASRMCRDRLRSAGVSYLDLTGNVWISIERPAVLIERQGADTDPDPPRRGVRSLRGAKAARIVRALCDWRAPVGVRELARRTGTNPGYVTRVLSLLVGEDVVVRNPQGEVSEVRWQDLLRRWSMDYSVTETNRAVPCLAPRGVPSLLERLVALGEPYALTGPFAVPPEAQVVPGRLLSCYVLSAERAAEKLDLRLTEAGANVLLLEPFDDVVFERTRDAAGARAVALTQCVVDLLTGSGRDPAQADALIEWMTEREDAWRA